MWYNFDSSTKLFSDLDIIKFLDIDRLLLVLREYLNIHFLDGKCLNIHFLDSEYLCI